VTTDGLTFYYDQNNIKSYQGPAIQNLASTITAQDSVGTGISIVGGSEAIDVPQIGPTSVIFSNIQNNYTSFSPTNDNCCPSPFRYTGTWGNGFTVSPSTLYTYGIVYKVLSGYTHPNYMYRYEFTASGGTYVTEAGVHSDSNRIHLGDGWYWAWGTFTTQASTNWIQLAGAWYYRYSNKNDKLSIAKVLIAPGNFTSLHPRYWPAVNTTRSSTQSAIDFIGRKTVTSNSLAYNTSGMPTFNGTSSYLEATIPTTSVRTVSMFYKLNNPGTGWGPLWRYDDWCERIFPNTINLINSNGTYYYLDGPDSSSNIINITYSYNGTNAKSYRNGVLQSNITMDGPMATGNFTYNFGRQSGGSTTAFVDMNLYAVQFYNIQLSDAQVLQNFNAFRGRFGI
jgi:hypothetical protein